MTVQSGLSYQKFQFISTLLISSIAIDIIYSIKTDAVLLSSPSNNGKASVFIL